MHRTPLHLLLLRTCERGVLRQALRCFQAGDDRTASYLRIAAGEAHVEHGGKGVGPALHARVHDCGDVRRGLLREHRLLAGAGRQVRGVLVQAAGAGEASHIQGSIANALVEHVPKGIPAPSTSRSTAAGTSAGTGGTAAFLPARASRYVEFMSGLQGRLEPLSL